MKWEARPAPAAPVIDDEESEEDGLPLVYLGTITAPA